ncbi:MarR family winged helix-turn-helix transcriptional regulator [Heyndrickxia camelliae]|uniref:MarR family transcriptional regulator n=1 Tax=Heyndrickxia camelliae TaxID=1707093 RepID=A0A2N3LFA8_9BACI|nr:MarR family transcriptional regulator [Heyndrickxia camelliae]PKR83332.1 MarR family transcriptional regulator [Heyndrickxia camelliae]
MNRFNNDILESFSEVNKAIYKLEKLEADKHGITVVQLKTIFHLHLHPNISLSELAEKLRLTNSTVSGVVERLVQHNFVERVVPPSDRRSISLLLSKKGEELLETIFSSDNTTMTRLNGLLEIPEEDIQHLFRLHKLVLSKLQCPEE